jgi:hypothetical protein
VGAELEEGELSEVGRDGTELAEDDEKVREAFEKVAARIEAHTKRFYLLSYCTPARKGTHLVRIDALADTNGNGKANSRGSLEYQFDAESFGPPPECDPERPPAFDMDKNLTPAPESDDAGKGARNSKGKAKAGGGKSPRPPGG